MIFEKGWVLLAAPFGLLSYFLIMRGLTGDAFAGVKAQKFYIATPSIVNLLDVGRFIGAYLNANVFHDYLHSFVDRFWFTGFLVSLPAIWKYNRALFYYALVLGFFSAIMLNFMSFMRFLSVIFPPFDCFLRYASLLRNHRAQGTAETANFFKPPSRKFRPLSYYLQIV